jgi:hypothetical protein
MYVCIAIVLLNESGKENIQIANRYARLGVSEYMQIDRCRYYACKTAPIWGSKRLGWVLRTVR